MANDIIDFTMLHKKGILQRAMRKNELDNANSKSEGSVVDFTKTNFSAGDSSSASPIASNHLAGFFGSVNSGSSIVESLDFGSLKIKLEDAEYKLERALERLDVLERKLAFIGDNKDNLK